MLPVQSADKGTEPFPTKIMDTLKTIFSGESWKAFAEKYFNLENIIGTGLDILLILVFAWIVSLLFQRLVGALHAHLLKRRERESSETHGAESAKRAETLTRLLRQVFRAVLWLVVALVILREFGVDVAPVIAGAGIIGLAVGFGAQNLVRDVISGFFIILEDQIRVGDVAEVNGTGGLVENITFRTTILRDLSGTVHVFPNGTITTLSNLTKDWSGYVFDIGVAYKENTDRVVSLIREVARELENDEKYGPLIVEPVEVFGVDKFDDSAVVIKGRIKTRPIKQWEVGREFLRRVKFSFDGNGVEIPFPHLSVYPGEASTGFDVRLLAQEQGPRAEPSAPASGTPAAVDPQPKEESGDS